MKKYYMTAERTLSLGFEIEAENDEAAQLKAMELFGALQTSSEEFESGGETFDYALDDSEGRVVVDWDE